MRPFPQPRHLIAVLLFAAVAGISGYFARNDDRMSPEQTGIATAALKRHDPQLMTNDAVFGGGNIWRGQTPAFAGLMELVLVPTAYRDPTLPFRIMVEVLVMIYLCGMYALLFNQCRSWATSAFVAILSMVVIDTFGRWYWGIGPLDSIRPVGLVQALSPLIVLAFLRYCDNWRLLLVFGFIGACANLHMIASMNLTIILLIVYLGGRRFSPSAWPMAIGCALASLLAAAPYLIYYFALKRDITGGQTDVAAAAAHRAFSLSDIAVLYPDLLKSLPKWLLMAGILFVPAAGSLMGVERFRLRDARIWMWFLGAAVAVAFVFHGASQAVGAWRGKAPPILGFIQASSLAMLPLYVLFAQTLTQLFRLLKSHRTFVNWACLLLLIAWFLPSDNMRILRHVMYDTATMFTDEQDKPQRVQDIHVAGLAKDELAAIANWAREKSGAQAVFIVDSDEFRMLARRAILTCRTDVDYVYYFAPNRLDDWTNSLARQYKLLQEPNSAEISECITSFNSRAGRNIPEWYIILPSTAGVQQIPNLGEIPAGKWGKHWRLFRISQGIK
ncbi:MAG: hypothetical protein HZA50_17570 [Planctomycetes bacterium]|nr:hypothetical protein [Planctomycetota bacterium]